MSTVTGDGESIWSRMVKQHESAPRSEIERLTDWKSSALNVMRQQDEDKARIMKALPSKYLGWNIWEAAADYIEKSELKEKDHADGRK